MMRKCTKSHIYKGKVHIDLLFDHENFNLKYFCLENFHSKINLLFN